jgi:hypothetical protein
MNVDIRAQIFGDSFVDNDLDRYFQEGLKNILSKFGVKSALPVGVVGQMERELYTALIRFDEEAPEAR